MAEYSTQISQTPKVSYLTADHLGSPRIITNENGAVISRHDYTGFGVDVAEKYGNIGGRTSTQGYGTDDKVRQQYTGYQHDDESGLEYAQARNYNSAHGRFTSVDPLMASANVKNPQTLNRYSYVLNSPYKFVDPLGLISSSTGACGQWCGGSGSYVDGSAFRGRDTSLAWAKFNNGPTADSQTNATAEPLPETNNPKGKQKQTQQVTPPKSLIDVASLNPINIYDPENKCVGTVTLTDSEIQARVALVTMVYSLAFDAGMQEIQRENGENVDVTTVQSTDSSGTGNSVTTESGTSVGAGSGGVTVTANDSTSNTNSSNRGSQFSVGADVKSGVGATVSMQEQISRASQSIINQQSGSRIASTQGGTTTVHVNVSPKINELVNHARTLGRVDGRLSYGRTRIEQ